MKKFRTFSWNGQNHFFLAWIIKYWPWQWRSVVQIWQSEFPWKEQTISQAETLPLIIARVLWGSRIATRRVYFCLDNNGVRFAMLKGTSNSLANRYLRRRFFELEFENPSFYWLLRVPSICNPADGPSRLLLEPSPDNLHAKCISPPSAEFIEAMCGLARWLCRA